MDNSNKVYGILRGKGGTDNKKKPMEIITGKNMIDEEGSLYLHIPAGVYIKDMFTMLKELFTTGNFHCCPDGIYFRERVGNVMVDITIPGSKTVYEYYSKMPKFPLGFRLDDLIAAVKDVQKNDPLTIYKPAGSDNLHFRTSEFKDSYLKTFGAPIFDEDLPEYTTLEKTCSFSLSPRKISTGSNGIKSLSRGCNIECYSTHFNLTYLSDENGKTRKFSDEREEIRTLTKTSFETIIKDIYEGKAYCSLTDKIHNIENVYNHIKNMENAPPPPPSDKSSGEEEPILRLEVNKNFLKAFGRLGVLSESGLINVYIEKDKPLGLFFPIGNYGYAKMFVFKQE